MIEIKINCANKKNFPISKKGGWFDIPTPEDILVKNSNIIKIKFDLRIKMPVGYEAIIQPRSSTLERWGLISSGFGVIEDSYCGPNDYIGYRFYGVRNVNIPAGTYLVQMRFQKKMNDIKLTETDNKGFDGIDRGGFGSTDKEYIDSLDIDFNTKSNNDYNNGFTAGHIEGYQAGYEEGFTNGYDQAVKDVQVKIKQIYAGTI